MTLFWLTPSLTFTREVCPQPGFLRRALTRYRANILLRRVRTRSWLMRPSCTLANQQQCLTPCLVRASTGVPLQCLTPFVVPWCPIRRLSSNRSPSTARLAPQKPSEPPWRTFTGRALLGLTTSSSAPRLRRWMPWHAFLAGQGTHLRQLLLSQTDSPSVSPSSVSPQVRR
jgi:hypothetical protein